MRCIIVTGMSGGGRTLTLRQLEDMGYFCVDNIPPQMISTLISMCLKDHRIDKAAVVVDTRAGIFFDNIYQAIKEIEGMGVVCDLLFLETADEVLIRRYKESRRRHPLNPTNITDGIAREREVLGKLRGQARYVVDTSSLQPRQLGDLLWGMFSDRANRDTILPTIISFGYKNGIPLDADLVFDVRFLPNPHYDPELKPYSGLQRPVREFVYSYEATHIFEDKLVDMLVYLLPHYQKEGKYQIVIAIGCTGGQHRSVAIAEGLHKRLEEKGVFSVVQHRDIGKDAQRD
jgi:UPF0042 nucleotide-binding protein